MFGGRVENGERPVGLEVFLSCSLGETWMSQLTTARLIKAIPGNLELEEIKELV